MNPIAVKRTMIAILAATAGLWCESVSAQIDLGRAIVVVPDGLSGPENKAVRLLVEEVRKRSRVGWDVMIRWPAAAVPVIAISPARLINTFPNELRENVPSLAAGKEKEGFRIQTNGGDVAGMPVVMLIGNDARGVLFGVGRLLRELRMIAGDVSLPGRAQS